jgi:hypothetical protein
MYKDIPPPRAMMTRPQSTIKTDVKKQLVTAVNPINYYCVKNQSLRLYNLAATLNTIIGGCEL